MAWKKPAFPFVNNRLVRNASSTIQAAVERIEARSSGYRAERAHGGEPARERR
jgi:hypothetical protein